MNRKEWKRRDKKVRELYKKIPMVKCQGKCTESCSFPVFTEVEKRRVANKHDKWGTMQRADGNGYIPETEDGTCPFLKEGRCSIYKDRPMVCRMFGCTPAMTCSFGCSTTITEPEEWDIIDEFFKVC